MKRIIGSAIFISDSGSILMGRYKRNGLFCTPGGKIDAGEYNKDGLIREIKEEIGIKVEREDIDVIGIVDFPDKLIFFYLVKKYCGTVQNLEPNKHHKWEWLKTIPEDSQIVEGIQQFRIQLESLQSIRQAA